MSLENPVEQDPAQSADPIVRAATTQEREAGSVTGLEEALDTTQTAVQATLKSTDGLARELRKARTAAASGQLRELRRALDTAAGLARQLGAAVAQARETLDFDEGAYMASGDYAKELLAVAHERKVAMFEEDERLLCYPSLVRIFPADSAIEIDRRRDRRLRPSLVIESLASRQQRPPKFRAEPFLESLAAAYELVISREGKKFDAVVRLTEIWNVLTLLPGQAKDYTRPEFARDLYRLDQKGLRQTQAGRSLRWHASSGTRTAGVLTTVAQTGQPQLYWGVSFTTAEVG